MSLLDYTEHSRRAAVEADIASLWGFPTPIQERNAAGQLVVSPARPYYAVYTNIFDLGECLYTVCTHIVASIAAHIVARGRVSCGDIHFCPLMCGQPCPQLGPAEAQRKPP